MTVIRDRRDRCPGALRPWQAHDGLLVRLRLVGGHVTAASLRSLAEVSRRFGDGHVHVTSRANLQVRALPGSDGQLSQEALAALEGTGLLPTRTHELVRNIMVSPLSGISGGRADVRPVAAGLDAFVCGNPTLAELPARFLFVLDDGRGDLLGRTCDLGLVALDATVGQVRIGNQWGPVIALASAPSCLARLAEGFLTLRGEGPAAAWHVVELAEPLGVTGAPDPRLPTAIPPIPYGPVPGGRHVAVSDTGLDLDAVRQLTAGADTLVITPWQGIIVPGEGSHA